MTVPRATLPNAASATPRSISFGGAVLLVIAGALAYANSFVAPFVFDDYAAIVANPSIRHLGSLAAVLSPPHAAGTTVGGRPIVNLTLALNHAISGDAVWSYHAFNLLVHLASGLVLFGLIRRTAEAMAARRRCGIEATELAFAIAALWLLHPLQTEAVTYIAQRAESLAGFFLLCTLDAFTRGAQAERDGARSGRRWFVAAVAACLLGIGSKEIVAVAPSLVLLYDRAFVAGSFAGAWRRHRGLYLALAATWLPLGGLVLGTAGRGGTAGFHTPVSPWTYALTQAGAVVHYLRLAFWPHPLVFDYGLGVVRDPMAVLPAGLLLLALLGATILALVRWPAAGFLGAWFFLILAPSSSFVPVASQPVAEHRMYLPLAAVLTAGAVGAYAWLGRGARLPLAAAALLGGIFTWQRNATYRSDLALWIDTVQHAPANARAHSNLGNALLAAGRAADAVAQYEAALRLAPDYADAENNLGRALAQLGRPGEAISHYETALQVNPRSTETLMNYGSALAQSGRAREAIAIYERALAIEPGAVGVRYNLGNAQLQLGNLIAARQNYEEAVRRDPAQIDARFNLAATLLRLGRPGEAMTQYEEILRRAPDDAAAHAELANLLAQAGRRTEAIAEYESALRLRPDFPVVRDELARLRAAGPE